jgi:hypothetical protein
LTPGPDFAADNWDINAVKISFAGPHSAGVNFFAHLCDQPVLASRIGLGSAMGHVSVVHVAGGKIALHVSNEEYVCAEGGGAVNWSQITPESACGIFELIVA